MFKINCMTELDTKELVKQFESHVARLRTFDKEGITHTILSKQGGKYRFEGLDYQKFLSLYTQIVKKNAEEHLMDLHWVEKPNDNGTTYLFIDIDFDQCSKERLYTSKHIEQIIRKCNGFIRDTFDVISQHHLETLVTEKRAPTKRSNNDMYKDGFHIYYPYLPMEEKHRYYVIDYLSTLMQQGIFLKNIDYKNDSDKIFDTSIIKSNGILMIGSKKEGGDPYVLTTVYDQDAKEKTQKLASYTPEELIHICSNRRYDADSKVAMLDVDDEKICADIEQVYDAYAGGNKKKTKKTTLDVDNISNYENKNDSNSKQSVNSNTPVPPLNDSCANRKQYDPNDIILAREISKILSKKRATNYDTWIRAGFALRAVSDNLYDAFVEFSKKATDKFNAGSVSCYDIWNQAINYVRSYGIENLRMWAREDDPRKYQSIFTNIYGSMFESAESGRQTDIAIIVHSIYKDRFVCVDINRKKWMEYKDHRWVLIQSAYTLEDLISTEVRQMLIQYCSEKHSQCISIRDARNESESRRYRKLMDKFDSLGDVRIRENIVRACANLFHDPLFQEKLDTNVYLVGFTNGVYDLNEGHFRDGLPSDYMSKTVGYNWINYNPNDPVFTKIDRFFSQVQTEEDLRTYLFTLIAKTLRGVPDSKLHIMTGGGGNGKSATIDLIRNILGDYFGTLPVTIITKKRGASNAATPEFADKHGKRLLVVQEPEHNDVIFVGQMKEYTGKDRITARPLYGDQFEYTPQFTIIMTCNNLPHIPASDNGTWRRLRVIPFESEFVDDTPSGPKQFIKDEDLQEEFKYWAQPLMWLIITKYYPHYKNGYGARPYSINEPEKVKAETKQYKQDSDHYAEFLSETMVATGSDKDYEPINFLYMEFKKWYEASYTDKVQPKKILVSYLRKNGYKVVGQNILGIKLNIGLD